MRAAGGSGERRPWEFGRFLETVLYFNPPPAPQDVLRKLFQGLSPPQPAMSAAGGADGAVQTLIPARGGGGDDGRVVLVTGATGGVGKRVVAQLLARGRRVRALVRDAAKARELLGGLPAAAGGSLELVAADVTQPATLLPEMFRGVGQVVCCQAVKVAPKEGDTADRSKYYQAGRGGWGAPHMPGAGQRAAAPAADPCCPAATCAALSSDRPPAHPPPRCHRASSFTILRWWGTRPSPWSGGACSTCWPRWATAWAAPAGACCLPPTAAAPSRPGAGVRCRCS